MTGKKILSRTASLWAVAVACMAAALLIAPLVRRVEDLTRWPLLGFGIEGARGVLGALAASLLTFIVFTFSILLLAVQMASGQLTPRIIARLFESRLTRWTVGAFVFAWVYAIAALGRIEERVPQLSVALAILLSLVSVILFLFLVQGSVQKLRPVTILTDLARDTRAVIEAVYPETSSKEGRGPSGPGLDRRAARKTVTHSGRSGAVLAIDFNRLGESARRAAATVEVVPQVGDFLTKGDDLFRLYGPGAEALNPADLSRCVSLGPERTLEQDPAFGFRIIVDIANKALSPAINDPTTAVLAIDQLHHLLLVLAQRELATGVVRDPSGEVRVVYRTPDWEDFVTLAATEIRLYGAASPQVTRRLQAMFEHLLSRAPEDRAAALRKEMSLLARTVERSFSDPEERAIALRGDLQGFGSRPHGRDSAAP
jgi:uncharacterized membrane protein